MGDARCDPVNAAQAASGHLTLLWELGKLVRSPAGDAVIAAELTIAPFRVHPRISKPSDFWITRGRLMTQ